MQALADRIVEEANRLGFVRVGFADAVPSERDVAALGAWIDRGDHASMAWMERTLEVRANPAHPGMLEGARTVIVVAMPYGAGPNVDLAPGRIARYARGRDYHRVLGKRLRSLATILSDAGFHARVAVDTKPVLERAYAALAGVGFVGKNACVIVPGVGSHVFLGTIVTDAELPRSSPIREGCGDCTRCLDGCPTEAFREPRVLDSRRCISYLTIEHEGPIDPELREGMGDWLFGCDVCQDVCPYNAGRASRVEPDEAFGSSARFEGRSLESIVGMDEQAFDEWSAGSPLRRAGLSALRRNASIVLGNVGGRVHLRVLDPLVDDEDPAVRGAAEWARGRIARKLDE